MTAGRLSRKPADGGASSSGRKERTRGWDQVIKISRPPLLTHRSSKDTHPKGSVTFPHSAIIRDHVIKHEPTGDISHSNYNINEELIHKKKLYL